MKAELGNLNACMHARPLTCHEVTHDAVPALCVYVRLRFPAARVMMPSGGACGHDYTHVSRCAIWEKVWCSISDGGASRCWTVLLQHAGRRVLRCALACDARTVRVHVIHVCCVCVVCVLCACYVRAMCADVHEYAPCSEHFRRQHVGQSGEGRVWRMRLCPM